MLISPLIKTYQQLIKPLLSFIIVITAVLLFSLFASNVAWALTAGNQSNKSAQAPISVIQVEKDTLVVGSEQDFPPFATGLADATAGGFTVDLWKAVAAETGLKYTIRVLPFHELLKEFKAGKIDVLINLATSKERHVFADFTVPHAIVHGGIFVRKGESSINSEADFAGKSIIVLNADLAHDYAVSKGWEQQLVLVDSAAEGMRLLASGKHDALLLSKLAGMQTLQALGLSNIEALKVNAGFSQKFAFAVREGHSELFSTINEALALTKANGTYDALYEKWFGIYETKEVGLRDGLKYLLPVLFIFLCVAQYFIYRRKIERKATQKTLQQSEMRLRLSQIAGGVGTWEADLVNNIQKLSENCTALLGIPTKSNPTWDDFLALVHPEDRQRIIDATQSHIEHGAPYDVEYRVVTTIKQVQWMRSTGQVERDANGKPIFMRGIVHDITARKLAEQALQENEHTLSVVLENVDAYIFLKDIQGRYLYANRKVCDLFGTSPEAIVGQGDEQFFDAETVEQIRNNDNQVLVEGKTLRTEETNLKIKNGFASTYLVVKLPLLNASGKIYALCGISTEITELKLMETQLVKNISLLSATLESTNDAIIAVDLHNNWISYNQRFIELWHITDDMIAVNDADATLAYMLNQLEDADTFLNKMLELQATPEVSAFDTLKFKNGKIIERYSKPQLVEGKVVGRVYSFRDVTERKQAEVKLIQSESFSRAIIEASPVPLALNDDDGNITYLNAAFVQTIGYTLSDIPTLADWWPLAYSDPQYRQQVIDNWQKNLEEAKRTNTPFTPIEINVQCKDGSLRTLICSASDIEGDFSGTRLVVMFDITERKNAESLLQAAQNKSELHNFELRKVQSALVESRDRYRDLYEFAPIGYLSVNNHGIISDINWKATAMFGLSRKDLNGHRFAEFIVDDDIERWQRMFINMKKLISGEDLSFDLKLTHDDGTVFEANLTCLRMDDEVDQPILRVTLTDVTKLKQVEAQLISSEAYLRNVIDNEPECIQVIDARGTLKQLNPAGLAMLEATSLEQATNIQLINFIATEYHQAYLDMHKRVIAGESVQLQYEIIGLKAGRRWVETHAVPMQENGAKLFLGVTRDITEHKQAEQRAESLLAEQTTMLDNKLVGMVRVRDRKIVWSNRAFELMHGYSHEELIDVPTRQLYANVDDYQAVGVSYADIENEGVTRSQHEFVRKDGQHIWLNMSGAMLNKEVGESLWAFVDVTAQKQAETAATEAYSLLKTVIDTAPIRIFWKDKNLHYLGCNLAFAIDAGKSSPQEVIGKDDYQMGWVAQAELYRADDRAVITSGIARLSYEEPQQTPSGQVIWLRTSKIPLMNSSNESLGILGIYEDITERKITENELRIAAIAFEAKEGMLITDPGGNILKVNRAFTSITGYNTDDVLGKNPRLLNSGQHDADFYNSMWKSIKNTGGWNGEIWNKRKNGEVYPEHLTITAVKDEIGVVTNYVATLTDITMSKAAAEEIQLLAFYDPLTRLPNRRLLVDRLNQALVSSVRNGVGGALLFMDLDHFKTLNDTLGHDIGDLLLQQVAERLTACVREGDTVSRLGGDEYVVMLEHLSEQTIEAAAQAEAVGEKILAALNQPYQLASFEYNCTASIGITLFSNHNQSQEDLLKHADIAMYQAKKEGRNAMRFFDPKMQDVIDARVSLENDLRKALENKEFQLHYQVQVDSTDQALGAEALIRWHQPKRGLVSPFDFIPLAEESGLIVPIGLWVLDTACAQLKAWDQNELTRDLTISVNVSAKQFNQADFVAQVQAIVQNHAINPMLLKLELTESMLINHLDNIIITMVALQAIGVRFELDDFGTGYSSLQYLKQLPLHQLKIDQSFIRDIATDRGDQAIVCTIISMAQSLNLAVIAEGVETEQQRQFLLNNGCIHYQGYLFSKPVPAEKFEELLKKV